MHTLAWDTTQRHVNYIRSRNQTLYHRLWVQHATQIATKNAQDLFRAPHHEKAGFGRRRDRRILIGQSVTAADANNKQQRHKHENDKKAGTQYL